MIKTPDDQARTTAAIASGEIAVTPRRGHAGDPRPSPIGPTPQGP